jgi:hypothetical protein
MGPIFAISVLIGWNIVTVYIILFNISEKNSDGLHKKILILIFIFLFATNCILFLNKKRVTEIDNRYKGESETSRKVGNFLVIFYVVLSLGIIVFG